MVNIRCCVRATLARRQRKRSLERSGLPAFHVRPLRSVDMRRSSLAFVALLASAVPLSAQTLDTRTGTTCVDAFGAPLPPERCWFDLRSGFGRDGYGEVFTAGANTALSSYSFFLADAGSGWTDLMYQSFLVGWDPINHTPIGDVLYRSSVIFGPTSPTYVEERFDANVLLTPGQFYAAMIIGIGPGWCAFRLQSTATGSSCAWERCRHSPSVNTSRIIFDAFRGSDGTYHDYDIIHPEALLYANDAWDMSFKAEFTDAGTVMAAPEPKPFC
jgi:hypothetical protein